MSGERNGASRRSFTLTRSVSEDKKPWKIGNLFRAFPCVSVFSVDEEKDPRKTQKGTE